MGDTIEIGGAVGHVLARSGPVLGTGNRTSVLFYTPRDDVTFERVTFYCEGGGPPCSFATLVIGTYIAILHLYAILQPEWFLLVFPTRL